MPSSQNNADIFRILVATDNHLGYAEKDSVRAMDSFITFEEILELAVEKDVDFILLGGDLFHDNKPSRHSLMKCMQLLRKYTFGDKPVHFDFVSDPTTNFPHLKNPCVNYQDPNFNVSIPVFSIHGNHDDPAGMGQFCALDMLSTAGLINYFGRINDLKEITISPLLMTKGDAKLALFGLSAVKDERLYRLFKENKVKMLRPREDMDDWFNIFVLHQNHARHSLTNYIPEQFLDNFLHLVIWGHEHECKIDPRRSEAGTFFVMQPGSSVATSLCGGEAVPKKVALLEINAENHMRVTGLDLKTIRPFVFEDLSLAEHKSEFSKDQDTPVEDLVESYVWKMIEESKSQLTGHPKQPKKPMIRLRVEYTDESQMFNSCRFGYKFAEVVANPDDIILFKKFRKESKKDELQGIDQDAMDLAFDQNTNESRVEDLVKKYFEELDVDHHQLELLTERGLSWGVGQFVDKDNRDAVRDIVKHQIEKTKEHLLKEDDLDENNIEEAIINYGILRLNKKQDDEEQFLASLVKNARPNAISDSDSDLDVPSTSRSPPKPTRGRGRGTSSRASKAGSSRTSKTVVANVDSPPRSTRGRGRGRGRGRVTSKPQSTMNEYITRPSQRSTQKANISYFGSDSD